MSSLFRGADTWVAPAASSHPGTDQPPPLLQSRYLTDGVNLFRHVGFFDSGVSRMVGLENCRTLTVLLLTTSELRTSRLRPVIPASDESPAG